MISMFKTLCDNHVEASYESIGKTYEGKDVWLFKAGNPNGGKVMYDGCLHGNEDITMEVLYLVFKWVLESGEPSANRILQRNYILFIPIVNVDSPLRGNNNFEQCDYGVDLNRNFVKGWTYTSPGYDSGVGTTYHGAYAGSELETQTMINAFNTYKPDFYANTHDGGGPYLAYYSGSNSSLVNQVITRMKEIANERGVTAYSTRSMGSNGFAIGDAFDAGACSWLHEFRAWNNEPYSVVTDELFPEFLPIFIAMCEVCESDVPLPPPLKEDTKIISAGGSVVYPISGSITIYPSQIMATNEMHLGFHMDHEKFWYFIPDYSIYKSQLQQYATDARFKLIRIFDFRPSWGYPRVMPCTQWRGTPESSDWDWSVVDKLTDAIYAVGAEPLFCLGDFRQDQYIPAGMPRQSNYVPVPDQYAQYCAEWVKHFKATGKPVKYYEIFNEPIHLTGSSSSTTSIIRAVVDCIDASRDAMKAENPNVLIGNDCTNMKGFFTYFLQLGCLDFISFHKYDIGGIGTTELAFNKAETEGIAGTGTWMGGVNCRQEWYNARGEWLPVICTEMNFNWDPDIRVQQMEGAIWLGLVLRKEIEVGFSGNIYFELTSNVGHSDYGLGMIRAQDCFRFYAYWVHWMIGNNLNIGDSLVRSETDITDVRVLAWINNWKINILIIHRSTQQRSITIGGITSQYNKFWIDDTYSWDNAQVQTGIYNAGETLNIQGYTVMLLRES